MVVNDGSTDGTLEILRTYEERYPHLRVIDKENGGPSSARNAGLDEAVGEYVFFFDADGPYPSRMPWRHCMRGQ